MICPYCKKEGSLQKDQFDKNLFGCSECHSAFSEVFLQAWNIGYHEHCIPVYKPTKKNRFDYSEYKCPFSHVEKECGHELKGPEGYQDDNGVNEAFRIWCSCGFRGPAFYLDPDELKLERKNHDPISRAD